MIWVSDSSDVSGTGIRSPEGLMFVIPSMTVLCTAGVAFYVRFLVALCKECRPGRIGYWVRLRLSSREATIVELQRPGRPVGRAA